MINIRYSALTQEAIPRLCTAYRNAYIETEGKDMSDTHKQNILSFIIDNYTSPDFLFLTACSGKKIAGFTILSPYHSADGIKSLWCDGIFVEKEYRKHIEIAKELFVISSGWAKKNEYKRAFAYEKIDDHTWDSKKEFGFKPIKTLLMREV